MDWLARCFMGTICKLKSSLINDKIRHRDNSSSVVSNKLLLQIKFATVINDRAEWTTCLAPCCLCGKWRVFPSEIHEEFRLHNIKLKHKIYYRNSEESTRKVSNDLLSFCYSS